MTTVGFFSPLATRSRPRLVLNLGWVLADAGFRVVLIDLDPSATLTELTGALERAGRTVFGELTRRRVPAHALAVPTPALVKIEESMWIAKADPRLAILDAAVAIDQPALGEALRSLIAAAADEVDADFVLCDLPAGLGHLVRVGIECSSVVCVPVSGRKLESYVAEGLEASWGSWRGEGVPFRDRFSWIEVHSGHDAENARIAVARLQEKLGGAVMGSLKEFPSLSATASAAQKADVALTMADGVSVSQLAAVADLRRQHEVLATSLLRATGAADDDVFREEVEQALYSAVSDEMPAALDTLSSGTSIHSIADVHIECVDVQRGGVRVAGAASVSVELHWGGGRDGVDTTMSFPMTFDVALDRSHASANRVMRLDVDTSSFYE
jgi:hypothetical protein